MSKNKINNLHIKMYMSYLEGKGCKLAIHDIETLHQEFGDLWESLFEEREKLKMKELM